MPTIFNLFKNTMVIVFLCLVLWNCSDQRKSVSASETDFRFESERLAAQNASMRSATISQLAEPETLPSDSKAVVIEQLAVVPAAPVTGDQLQAIVNVTTLTDIKPRISYCWKINGQVVQESEASILGRAVKRGDYVEVSVSDSDSATTPLTHCVFVGNAFPLVQLAGQSLDDNGLYLARLDASDPEGDPITLELKRGPSGMNVDAVEGIIRWSVPREVKGVFEVQVSAKDSQGAETLLNYDFGTNWELSNKEEGHDASLRSSK